MDIKSPQKYNFFTNYAIPLHVFMLISSENAQKRPLCVFSVFLAVSACVQIGFIQNSGFYEWIAYCFVDYRVHLETQFWGTFLRVCSCKYHTFVLSLRLEKCDFYMLICMEKCDFMQY